MTGLVVLGIGGALAVGAALAFVLSTRGGASSSTESAESVLEGAPPRRTDEQNRDATARAVGEGFGFLREGLSLVRDRLQAGDDAAAIQRKVTAGESAEGEER